MKTPLVADPQGLILLFENPRSSGTAMVLDRLRRQLGSHADRLVMLSRQPLNRFSA